jgi:hypothetical protein
MFNFLQGVPEWMIGSAVLSISISLTLWGASVWLKPL